MTIEDDIDNNSIDNTKTDNPENNINTICAESHEDHSTHNTQQGNKNKDNCGNEVHSLSEDQNTSSNNELNIESSDLNRLNTSSSSSVNITNSTTVSANQHHYRSQSSGLGPALLKGDLAAAFQYLHINNSDRDGFSIDNSILNTSDNYLEEFHDDNDDFGDILLNNYSENQNIVSVSPSPVLIDATEEENRKYPQYQEDTDNQFNLDNTSWSQSGSQNSLLSDPKEYANIFQDEDKIEISLPDTLNDNHTDSASFTDFELTQVLSNLRLDENQDENLNINDNNTTDIYNQSRNTSSLPQVTDNFIYSESDYYATNQNYTNFDYYCLPCQEDSQEDKLIDTDRTYTNSKPGNSQPVRAKTPKHSNTHSPQPQDSSLPKSRPNHNMYKQPNPSFISPSASEYSQSIIESFHPQPSKSNISSTVSRPKSNERLCLGHKETIFGLSFSPCGKFLATASQDSTVCIWGTKKNNLLSKISDGHSKNHECLRVSWASSSWGKEKQSNNSDNDELILATAGADGMVNIWESCDGGYKWDYISKLNHMEAKPSRFNKLDVIKESSKSSSDDNEEEEEDSNDKEMEEEEEPQIYTLQFIDKWFGFPSVANDKFDSLSLLMTSSDDFIHLWQKDITSSANDNDSKVESTSSNDVRSITLNKVMDIQFTHLEHGFGGVFVHINLDDNEEVENQPSVMNDTLLSSNIITRKTPFGGPRNPDNLVYVFDSVQCPANDLLGVALSDGTLRLVNGRGVCMSILQLPGCQSHLTSCGWDKSGTRLTSCVGTGHVVLWNIHGDGRGRVTPSCQAVLEGGHELGRPLYGSSFFGGENEDLLLSWGVDGKLCLWDSNSAGEIKSPLAVLISKKDYPIFAVDVTETLRDSQGSGNEKSDKTKLSLKSHIAVGGGRDGGLIGTPVYLYDIWE